MGEKDGVGMGWIYDGVGRLGAWGLGRRAGLVEGVGQSWAGKLGLWRHVLVAWVSEVGR